MIYLRTFVFYFLFYSWTVVLALACVPVIVLPRAVSYAGVRVWAHGVLWLLRVVCGLRHTVEGREHIPDGPAIYAIKHQSAWETIALLVLVPPFTAVLKRELLRIPIYGWYMHKLGMIPIDRSRGAAAMKRVIRRARIERDRGRSFMIAPEGTRTKPGETGRYQPGVAALYKDLGLPLIPVALNSGHFWPKGRWLKPAGTITIRFLPPVPPGLAKDAFLDTLREAIEPATRELEARVQPAE